MPALTDQRSRMWALIASRSSWPGTTPRCARAYRGEFQPPCRHGACDVFGFTSAMLFPSFSKARPISPARVASTAALRSGSR